MHVVRLFALTLFVCLPPILSPAVPPPNDRTDFPYAVVYPEKIYLGVAEHGSMLRSSFTVRNEGAKDLLIAGVRSSCGVMIPGWPRGPIVPGDSAVIHLRYDTSRLGKFTRLITLHTNAWQKTLVVELQGEIRVKTTDAVR